MASQFSKPRLRVSCLILTFNEEIHIGRCLANLPISSIDRVDILDSGSTDNTTEIASSFPKTRIIRHSWEGSHSAQIKWYLDNFGSETEYLLRLDADEYLSFPKGMSILDLIKKMELGSFRAATFSLKRVFLNRELKFGNLPINLIRLIRVDYCTIDNRPMDEKFLVQGNIFKSKVRVIDHSLISIDRWTEKHLVYSKQELKNSFKSGRKGFYYRLPKVFRSITYFVIRYFILLGFLDGKAGFYWAFFQGLWYRIIIDFKNEIQE